MDGWVEQTFTECPLGVSRHRARPWEHKGICCRVSIPRPPSLEGHMAHLMRQHVDLFMGQEKGHLTQPGDQWGKL